MWARENWWGLCPDPEVNPLPKKRRNVELGNDSCQNASIYKPFRRVSILETGHLVSNPTFCLCGQGKRPGRRCLTGKMPIDAYSTEGMPIPRSRIGILSVDLGLQELVGINGQNCSRQHALPVQSCGLSGHEMLDWRDSFNRGLGLPRI